MKAEKAIKRELVSLFGYKQNTSYVLNSLKSYSEAYSISLEDVHIAFQHLYLFGVFKNYEPNKGLDMIHSLCRIAGNDGGKLKGLAFVLGVIHAHGRVNSADVKMLEKVLTMKGGKR